MLAAPPGWAPPARRKDGRLHKERQAACAEMETESGSGRRQQTPHAAMAVPLRLATAVAAICWCQLRLSHENAKLECTVMVMMWLPLLGATPAMLGGSSVSILAPSSCSG